MSDFETLTPVINPGNRAGQPDLYTGDLPKLKTWLLQLDLYFHCIDKDMEDKDKVIFAATYMRGEPADWIQPYIERYLASENAEGDQIDELIEDYSIFRTQLKQLFGSANEESYAEEAIQRLRQTSSAAEYTAKFKHYAVQTKWNIDSLRKMYMQGLKKFVRGELLRSGVAITTMQELYDETIRIDAEWHALDQEYKHHGKFQPTYGKSSGRTSYRPIPTRQTVVKDTYGYGPMELDNIVRGKEEKNSGPSSRAYGTANAPKPFKRAFGKLSEERTPFNQKEQRTCYACDKPGHIARNCRSKNKVIRRVHTLAANIDDDDEWVITDGISDIDLNESSERSRSPDSRLYEDAEEPTEDFKPVRPRAPTPHPQAKKLPPTSDDDVEVFRYLETHQPRDGDLPQGAALYLDENPTWRMRQQHIAPALREWADIRYQSQSKDQIYPNEEKSYEPDYTLDYRNPKHLSLRWNFCERDDSTIHYHAKQSHYFPNKTPRCRWEWFDCPIDDCDEHLWDKRKCSYFPRHSDSSNATMRILLNGKCMQEHWQTCLHPDCKQHKISKRMFGFGKAKENKKRQHPEEEAEETFEEESFLDQRADSLEPHEK